MVNHYYVLAKTSHTFLVDVDITTITFENLADSNAELLLDSNGEQLQVVA